jgi:hypothetical protein
MSNTPEKLKPFEFHGLVLSSGKGTVNTECPFCNKDKFFIKVSTGQWSCKTCTPQGGNIYAFLKRVWEEGMTSTTDEAYEELSKDRNIPVEELKEWGLCLSPISQDWIAPAHNMKGALANLYKLVQLEEKGRIKWTAYSTPTCNLHPFGVLTSKGNYANKLHKTVWVSEGLWDGMKLRSTLKKLRLKGPCDDPLERSQMLVRTGDQSKSLVKTDCVIAAPGCGTFNPEWLDYFEDRNVCLVYDSDHPKKLQGGQKIKPGFDGMKRVIKLISESAVQPASVYMLRWGPNGYDKHKPTGYDIRDLFNEMGDVKGFIELLSKLSLTTITSTGTEEHPDEIEMIECNSFAELCGIFEQGLHLSQRMRDGFAVALAATLSTPLGGDQLWVRLIGPPGCGKSTIAECISADRKHAFPQSIVTGWHSGYVGNGPESKKDASLIPAMNNKIVVIKDADTIASSSSRDRILSELRDIFDGVSRSAYRNRKGKSYDDLRMSFLLCGTDHLRTLNKANLGDRFLDCEMMGDEDKSLYVNKAVQNVLDNIRKSHTSHANEHHGSFRNDLKLATVGFLHSKFNSLNSLDAINFSEDNLTKIKSFGEFVSFMRAKVQREGENAVYRPRPELATRVSSQLTKLAYCLALILGKKSVDRDIMRIVKNVTFATATGYMLDLTERLASSKKGLSTHQLETSVNLSESTVRRTLSDMQDLKIVEKNTTPNNSGIRGRNLHLWKLTEKLQEVWTHIGGNV